MTLNNGIELDLEITKSDLKTVVNKATSDNRFNAFKNKFAQNIPGFIKKAKYLGWRNVIDGKHPEAAYFVYFNRQLNINAYLCLRKMKGGNFKPYAIINEEMFSIQRDFLIKAKPPK